MKGTSLLQRLTKSVPRKSGLIQDLAGSHCTAMHPDLNTCEVLCSQKTNVAQAQGEGMPAALGNNSMLLVRLRSRAHWTPGLM